MHIHVYYSNKCSKGHFGGTEGIKTHVGGAKLAQKELKFEKNHPVMGYFREEPLSKMFANDSVKT